jgi:hypothetical protein
MTIILKISLVLGGLNTLAAACDNNPVGVERVHQQHALPHLERILVSGPSLGTRSVYHLESLQSVVLVTLPFVLMEPFSRAAHTVICVPFGYRFK